MITGTRKGIGRELAKYYAESGNIVIGCSRGENSLDLPGYFHYLVDIGDEKAVRALFSEIRKKFGRLDILINNAAVNLAHSPTVLVSFSSAELTMRTNFLGSYLLSREAVKIMMKHSFGRIINFGSMTVKLEESGGAIYTASKAALGAFTKILAKEVYQYGITCNVVSPAAIKTDLMDTLDPELLQSLLKRNAIPDIGTTDELIHVINWLIDSKSYAITGQNIYLGGA
jgi:3-oxoacyl-[acyl-carrier protein] reductase